MPPENPSGFFPSVDHGTDGGCSAGPFMYTHPENPLCDHTFVSLRTDGQGPFAALFETCVVQLSNFADTSLSLTEQQGPHMRPLDC
jgi:hypothetical protein